MDKQLSLIILTYNSEKDIYDCLASVHKYNDIGEELEIIVVDNNSANFETMHSKLQELYPDVIVIKNEKNGGYGQGNNVGIRASSAPIVAVMNPDIRLVMPVFATMLYTLRRTDVIMCGGKQYKSIDFPAYSFYYDHDAPAVLQSFIFRVLSRLDCYDYKRMWLHGAFFAIKKDIFSQIGYFDERIFMYAEEFNIHRRLRSAFPTKKMIYLPQLKYLHLIQDRQFSEDNAYKELKSDVFACSLLGISPMLCIRRKKMAAHTNYAINRLLSIIPGRICDKKNYQVQLKLLRKIQKDLNTPIT